MKNIPNGAVDMVLTDPPFSSGGLFAGDRKAGTETKYCNTRCNGVAPVEQNTDEGGNTNDSKHFE